MKIAVAALSIIVLLACVPASVHSAIRSGDANGDDEVTADDVDGLVSELFDGDGDATGAVGTGTFAGAAGADGNDDSRVTAADLALMPPLVLAPFWEALRDVPGPRQETGTAELEGRIYLLGGIDEIRDTVTTVEYYDVAANRWVEVAPLPEPLHHIVAASAGGRVFALGGLRAGFAPDDSVYAYDPAANEWEQRASLPAPRGAGAAAVVDGLIYVAGGLRQGSVSDFAVYDPQANQWTPLRAMPTARDHLGAAAIDGIFYAVGGRAGVLFDALEAFDPRTGQWRTDLEPMPTARGGLAVVALRGRLFAFGGEGNSAEPILRVFPHVEAYDVDTGNWSTLPDMLTPRHGMGAAAVRGRLVVPGGATREGFLASDANETLWP